MIDGVAETGRQRRLNGGWARFVGQSWEHGAEWVDATSSFSFLISDFAMIHGD
jgi:hypothetical protein